MSYTERYCYSCSHWRWKGKGIEGYCAMYSSACATHIGNHKSGKPPYYLSMEEVYEEPKVEDTARVQLELATYR